MSKVTLLHRSKQYMVITRITSPNLFYLFLIAVQHIQHLKRTQMSILAEMERLMQENEELRK